MNILITGANGQLGSEFRVISQENSTHNFIFTDIEELDLTDSSKFEVFFSENKIDLIVNCAAYTSVDNAETEIELAEKINITAVEGLKNISEVKGIKFIHISTDYVFDGTNYKPYTEDEITSPNSVYGRTKLASEEILRKSSLDYLIVRTSWLYSSYGNNFVKTIIRLSKERNELNVISDQIGTPTYAYDLASAIYSIIEKYNETGSFQKGVFHFSNEGACSWYDFATKIIQLCHSDCVVYPIGTHKYPTPAKRPYYSVLDKDKIKQTFDIKIPHWEKSLGKCIQLLKY